jgi:hypothetical protein
LKREIHKIVGPEIKTLYPVILVILVRQDHDGDVTCPFASLELETQRISIGRNVEVYNNEVRKDLVCKKETIVFVSRFFDPVQAREGLFQILAYCDTSIYHEDS